MDILLAKDYFLLLTEPQAILIWKSEKEINSKSFQRLKTFQRLEKF